MTQHRLRLRVLVLALAGAATAAGVLASLPATEAAAAALPSDSPRFSLSSSLADCPSGLLLSVAYDDHVDGHRPVAVNEQLAGSSGVFWERNELNQVAGDYYGVFAMYLTGQQEGPYTYTVTISYDDDATETLSTQAMEGQCDSNAPPVPSNQRFEIKHIGFGCPDTATSVEFALFDADDGHVADQVTMSLGEEGGQTYNFVQVLPPGFDARFVSVPFPRLGQPPSELRVITYTLTMTVTYDDGVEESHSRSVDLAALCGAGSASPAPTSSVPLSQLPETGVGDAMWILGAIAGLLTTAGAALFAGARRRRTD